ncbi:MAG: DUF4339 domain-containing protein [Candidatus Tectomicrobia bacterium]|nr:DUF4339 domain-containing protein [Candidatus Tectomicrobia bacterium]
MWHHIKNGQQQGPIDEDALKALIASAVIPPSTPVWKTGMADWVPADSISELSLNPPHTIPPVLTKPTDVSDVSSMATSIIIFWSVFPVLLVSMISAIAIILVSSKDIAIANIIGWITYLVTVVWVGIDSKLNRIPPGKKPYSLNNGALAWSLTIALLGWIGLLPYYLIKRARFLKRKGADFWQSVLAAVIGCCFWAVGVLCVILSYTGDIKIPVSDLQGQVRQSIEQKFQGDSSIGPFKIINFSLVHKQGNEYSGLLEVEQNGTNSQCAVQVTYDGKQFMWQLQ